MKNLLKKICVTVSMVMLLSSCQKEEASTTSGILTKLGGCVVTAKQKTNWSYALTEGFVLTHTAGLEQMALSGNTGPLNNEFCELGEFNQRIPSGLGDDIYDKGYAPQIVFGDYIVAMYHPIRNTDQDDHFITYNHVDGSWIHWDLSHGPDIVIQSTDE